jgi:hypothetical protein
MPLDLSTLTIPPADVVPEPTAEDWSLFCGWLADFEFLQASCIYSLARRCRELEAQPTAALDWQAKRIAELEDEVARLRKSCDDEDDILANWPGSC